MWLCFYFKKHILEICDLKMKNTYSFLFSFGYSSASPLAVHRHCDFNINVLVWIIRTEKFCILKPQKQIMYLLYSIYSDCVPFLRDKVKSRAVAKDTDCACTQHLAVDQLISEESKL
jgi:hypothetical protein